MLKNKLHGSERQEFLQTLNESYEGLFDFVSAFSSDENPYIVYDVLRLNSNFYRSIREYGHEVWKVLMDATRLLSNMDEQSLTDKLGVPGEYYPQILGMQHLGPADMRFDIAVDPEDFISGRFTKKSFKIIEVNAATPSFFWETFEGNRLFCEHFNVLDPNGYFAERHTHGIEEHIRRNSKFPQKKVFFSFPFSGDDSEDILSFDLRVGLYQSLYGEGKAEFIYTDDIVFNDEGAFTASGERIYNLFLHYPAEWAVFDEGVDHGSKDDSTPWQIMTNLILEGKLSKFPSITAEVLQNKRVLSFLYTEALTSYFDAETSKNILDLIPPTFFTFEEANTNLEKFWKKPIYGRQGKGIILYDKQGNNLFSTYDEDPEDSEGYQSMPAIFQEDLPMPVIQEGDSDLQLLFTLYVAPNGVATGVGCRPCRINMATTTNDGLYLPLGLSA